MPFFDRVKETTTSTQTLNPGTVVNLAGAVAQFQSFVAGYGHGAAPDVCFVSGDGSAWQVCQAVVTSGSPNTLTIGAFRASSTGAAITLTSPTTVFGDASAFLLNRASLGRSRQGAIDYTARLYAHSKFGGL
jgi:hypothetical protein